MLNLIMKIVLTPFFRCDSLTTATLIPVDFRIYRCRNEAG